MRDPYKILGVNKDAGAEEIKAAWRSAAKSSHPDQNRNDPDATRKFAEIGRAYEVLKDPAKRSRYDSRVEKEVNRKREQTIQQQREAARQAAREAAEKAQAAKANAERVMAELAKKDAERAKAAAMGQTAQAKPTGRKGENPEDVVSRIFGDSPEAAAAAQNLREESEARVEAVETPGSKQQQQQNGTHFDPIEFITALLRKFRGGSNQPEKAPDQFIEATVTIEEMLKAGWVNITLPEGREIRFSLEGGYTDGHLLRLKGQGYKIPNMLRGDVVVTLRVAKHERYALAGHDIHTVLPVTLENAVLGQKTTVTTLDGEVEVEIPAWSSSDQAIRLEGKGLPDGSGGRGALVLDLRVVLWEKPDAKVTDLMRHMREGLYI